MLGRTSLNFGQQVSLLGQKLRVLLYRFHVGLQEVLFFLDKLTDRLMQVLKLR